MKAGRELDALAQLSICLAALKAVGVEVTP